MHHPTDRIAHTTAFVTPAVEQWLEREIAVCYECLNKQLIAIKTVSHDQLNLNELSQTGIYHLNHVSHWLPEIAVMI